MDALSRWVCHTLFYTHSEAGLGLGLRGVDWNMRVGLEGLSTSISADVKCTYRSNAVSDGIVNSPDRRNPKT